MPMNFASYAKAAMRRIPPSLLRALGRPAAVFFHGVDRSIGDPRVQYAHHEEDAFYDMARALKKNFQVLPLSNIEDVIRHPQRHRRSIFLMSDDGLANVATVAAGILQDLGLPWTLFVSTHHVDTGERLPSFLARLFFTYAPAGRYEIPNFLPAIELPDIDSSGGAQRAALAKSLAGQLKALEASRARQSLEAMVQALSPQLPELLERFPSERLLDWEQVAALHKRGVEIGAHAHVHWPMHANQLPEYLREQATLSRARIEQHVGPCRFFAYPFGGGTDIGPGAWRAVRDAGYDYAFTAIAGSLTAAGNPYLLPRYFLRPDDLDSAALVPLLRTRNRRLRAWQRQVAD